MKKGEVWWVDQPKPIGRRPVVLITRNQAYAIRNAVTVALVTTTIRNIPVEVSLEKKDGLPRKCVVNLDTIRTVKKAVLIKKICALDAEKIARINKAIRFALDL